MIDDSLCGYLIRCDCGGELRAGTGQAGATVRCPRCGAGIRLPKLSQLRELPLVAGLVEERNPWQFTLGALFVFITFAALFTTFGNAVGFHWLFLALPVCAVIGISGALAPRPVLYGIVLGTVFLLLGTLTICSVLQTREISRRIQAADNLREIGIGWGQARKYFPAIDNADSQRWAATQSEAVQPGP